MSTTELGLEVRAEASNGCGPTSAVMREETKRSERSHSGCATRRWRTSGSSPVWPEIAGTSQPAVWMAVITAAMSAALAHTTSSVAFALRAARTWGDTSAARCWTVWSETTAIRSCASALRSAPWPA